MKTIILKVKVPDDAEKFSVSWRRPAEPEDIYDIEGFVYTRDRNPEVLNRPTDEEIEEECKGRYMFDYIASAQGARFLRDKIWGDEP